MCRKHGGSNEKTRAVQRVTHGQTSKYYSEAEVDTLLDQYRHELDTKNGVIEALKDNYAKIKARESRLPAGEDYTELAIKAAKSKREDILAIHELTAEEKPNAPTTFIVNGFDQAAPFQSRCPEGPCTVRYLEGNAFMLDALSGAWVPCSEQVDDESGARYYVRMLAV